MRKKAIIALMLCMALVLLLAACGGGKQPAQNTTPSSNSDASKSADNSAKPADQNQEQASGPKQINGGKPVKLLVDFHSMTPTLNEKPTAEQPNVFRSSQKLADEFMKLHPNVTVEWVRNKPPQVNMDSFGEWMTTQIAAGTAPDIVFAWGSVYADRGWFMKLNDVLEQPNEYVEGNTKWKDMFADYLWTDSMEIDAAGNIVAIPLTLFPGPPTAYYYNKQIFDKVGVQPPKDWEDFLNIAKKINEAGYVAVAPWGTPGGGNKKINTGVWDVQFSLGPAYAGALMDKIDYNKDGVVDPTESVRAAYEGYFFTQPNDYAKELWQQVKRKYTTILQKGYENTDYEPMWLDGKVAMMEDGLWRLPGEQSNTKRKFDFDLFPAPVITDTTSKYVAKIEFTEAGPYQPAPMEAWNIVEPSIQAHGGEGVREAAIAFLKFMSKPENLSMMILERRGQCIGAVKGTEIPPELNEWFKNPFPKLPRASWPGGFTTEGNTAMSKQLEMWIKGMVDDATFYKNFDDEFKKDIEAYIKKMKIDTTGWKKGW